MIRYVNATSLKNECLKCLVGVIDAKRKEKHAVIEAIASYIQQLPDFILDELYRWLLLTKRFHKKITSNEVAICFHPKKKIFKIKLLEWSDNMEHFFQHFGRNFANINQLRIPYHNSISTGTFQKMCASSPNLQMLGLRHTTLPTGCLEHLNSLSLVELDLSCTNISGKELDSLLLSRRSLLQKSLRILNTENTVLSLSDHIRMLKYFSKLEEINMDYDTTSLVPKLTNVITGVTETNDSLFYSNSTPIIKKLKLGAKTQDTIISHIEKFKRVEHLTLIAVCNRVAISILFNIYESLKYLDLNRVKFSDTYTKLFFPSLESLTITGGGFDDVPSQVLVALLNSTPKLVNLKISLCKHLTNAIMFDTCTNCNLKNLRLIFCNVDIDGLMFLIDVPLNKLEVRLRYNDTSINLITEKLKKDKEWTFVNYDEHVFILKKFRK